MKQSLAESLERYVGLIRKYHRSLDLMSEAAVTDIDRMVAEALRYGDLVESLSPAPCQVIDLGSGVGLPGIPMALRLPRHQLTLVERRRRRAAFLRIAVSQLGMENVSVQQGDVLEMSSPCAEVIVAQAVGTLKEVFVSTRHLHGEKVWLVSRKGGGWREEVSEVEAQTGSAVDECREEPLSTHGTLVAVLVSGGSACPPSG